VEGIDLGGKQATSDSTIKRVIDAQAQLTRLRKENAALKRDREDLLQEHEDMRRSRPVTPFEPRQRRRRQEDTIRVAFGDMHGMRMDRLAVNALLADIERIAPDEIVIGGDMLECGGWLAKHHALGYVANCDYSYQEDIAATSGFLDELQKCAPRAKVIYLEGNHEDRVERWIVDETLGHQRDAAFLHALASPARLLRLEERGIKYIRRSDKTDPSLPYGWIKLGKMHYTHELSGGKTAAGRAVAMTAGNVTAFHTHQESSATLNLVAVGICKAFFPGCLCDLQPVWQHSDPDNWTHGYCLDVVAASGNFQHIQVPIWNGESLGCSLLDRK
jgi:hypothetical protein